MNKNQIFLNRENKNQSIIYLLLFIFPGYFDKNTKIKGIKSNKNLPRKFAKN